MSCDVCDNYCETDTVDQESYAKTAQAFAVEQAPRWLVLDSISRPKRQSLNTMTGQGAKQR